jgi:Holliday junction DNA helicase RuvA
MIGYLRGTLADKGVDTVIVDVHGVGYRVLVSQTSLASLPAVGAGCELRIHTHVREDALSLIGFVTPDEEELFHHLTTVSGVGPRLALNILSGMQPAELAHAVASGEIARLTKISGVGKKTAERLVVELADKLKTSAILAKRPGLKVVPRSSPADDLQSALTNLGYRPADAERAASAARERAPGTHLEEQLRVALQLLATKAV